MSKKPLRFAFRITHIDNLPDIMENGLTLPISPKKNEHYVNIGDSQVINIRKDILPNGIRLSDYIPFYFGPRSPMLYVIQNGYNGVLRRDAKEIVYCVIRLSVIIESNIDCIFTDGHALSALTEFYGKESLTDINSIINFDDVYATYWNNDSDLDLKRRKEAELLIKSDLPYKYIKGYIVYNNEARTKLLLYGIPENMIVVGPNYYF